MTQFSSLCQFPRPFIFKIGIYSFWFFLNSEFFYQLSSRILYLFWGVTFTMSKCKYLPLYFFCAFICAFARDQILSLICKAYNLPLVPPSQLKSVLETFSFHGFPISIIYASIQFYNNTLGSSFISSYSSTSKTLSDPYFLFTSTYWFSFFLLLFPMYGIKVFLLKYTKYVTYLLQNFWCHPFSS